MPPARSLATAKEVAAYLKKSEQTLANWRYLGIGPPYIKDGDGTGLRYRWEDVEAWLRAKTITPGKTA